MLKRVEKHQRRKEAEEKLGLTEDMKEVLGMHETDSDESDSSSSEDSSSDSSSEESDEGKAQSKKPPPTAGVKRKRDEEDSDDESSSEDEDESPKRRDGGSGDSDGDDNDEEDEGEERKASVKPNITVRQALETPIYVASSSPEVKACAVCPGKLIKNTKMETVHLGSHGHARRVKRLRNTTKAKDYEEQVWGYLRDQDPEQAWTPPSGMSARAIERKRKLEAVKDRRRLRKLMKAKAKIAKLEKDTALLKASGANGTALPVSKKDPKVENVEKAARRKARKEKRKQQAAAKAAAEPPQKRIKNVAKYSPGSRGNKKTKDKGWPQKVGAKAQPPHLDASR